LSSGTSTEMVVVVFFPDYFACRSLVEAT
jgi:hypothetical protein